MIENREQQGGGAREGAGRPEKHNEIIVPISHAFEFVAMAYGFYKGLCVNQVSTKCNGVIKKWYGTYQYNIIMQNDESRDFLLKVGRNKFKTVKVSILVHNILI